MLYQSISTSSGRRELSRERDTQPCNTPTASSSFSWGQMMDAHAAQRHTSWREDAMDDMEDERMVEDLLVPSSPASASSSTAGHYPYPQHTPSRSRSQSKSHRTFSPSTSSFPAETSHFTTTDPFYIAQLQNSQNHHSSPSVFSQIGNPSQQSPFLSQQQSNYSFPRRESHTYMAPSTPLALDTHSFLVTASTGFER